jgi:hypothetical protein
MDIARDRPDDVAGAGGQGHYAGVRDQTEARLDPDQRLGRSRILNRTAGLLAQAEYCETAGHGCGGSGAAAAGQQARIDRIERRAGPTVVCVTARGAQHWHIGLAQDHRACGPKARDHRRIGLGDQIDAAGPGAEQAPTAGARQPGHVDGVLDDHRNAGQRAKRFPRLAPPIDFPGVA